jgi:precorrin-6Y C5,15-methyltransferase (decarboxylating)
VDDLAEWLSIVGIGEDGWNGLSCAAKSAVQAAEVIFGGSRHLSLIPDTPAVRIAWPSPMLPALDELIVQHRRRRAVTVLASGDPMLYGVGTVLASRLHAPEFRVIPQVSAFTLACARLGWSSAEIALVSIVHRPIEQINRHLYPCQRLIIYSENGSSPGRIAQFLKSRGYGKSTITVFEHLGGEREKRYDMMAQDWSLDCAADLNVVAVNCNPDETIEPLPMTAGLPDDAYETDGQLTKCEVRAVTLARLAPLPGQTLWDVGAGTGSVGIEWMRAHSSCRTIAFECRADRAERIRHNANRLGTAELLVVTGKAPATFEKLEQPDAIFIGGGVSAPDLVLSCWDRLRPGGRLVANTVTIAGEATIASWQMKLGGELSRITITRSQMIGGMLGWRALTPVTQWVVVKR